MQQINLTSPSVYFNILFSDNPLPMWIYDLESLGFLSVNDAAVQKYGYSHKEFLAMTILDIREREDHRKVIQDVKTNEDSYQWSRGWRHTLKGGDVIDVEILSHEFEFNNRKARLVTVNDVTAAIRAETALIESEKKYRSALDHMKEGFQIISPDYSYIYVNYAAAAQGKNLKEELIGHKMVDKYPGIDKTVLFTHIRRCMEERVPARIENEFFYADGTSAWYSLSIERVPDGVLILSTDITDQKKAHSEIVRLNRVYNVLSNINQAIVRIKNRELLFETAGSLAVNDGKFKLVWIGTKNNYGKFVKASVDYKEKSNPLYNRIYSLKEFPFWTHEAKETVLGGSHFVFDDLLNLNTGRNTSFKMLLDYGCLSGIIFPLVIFDKVEGLVSLFAGEKGFFEEKEIALLTEMVQDISFALETFEIEKRRLKVELELKASEERFYNAFEYAAVGMVLTGPKGKFLKVNRAFCDITGYTKSELLSMTVKDLTHPGDIEYDLRMMKNLISGTQKIFRTDKKYIRKSGKEVWVNLNTTLLRDSSGVPLYFITEIQDITDKKEIEDHLILAKERAEEMNRLKNNFLANMSHELRTPMIGILGTADIIRDAGSLTEIQEFLPTFEESAGRLLRTLNQILDLSKIEAEKPRITITAVDASELVSEVVSLYSIAASKKHLAIEKIFRSESNIIKTDSDLVSHILQNLVHNAIKFTASGSVTIEVERKNVSGSDVLEISVKDTGTGIPPDKIDQVFQPFRQASEGYARRFEGTGLGLTIAKRYTELLNGEIAVESKLGEGTIFSLRLPVEFKIMEDIPDPSAVNEYGIKPAMLSAGSHTNLLFIDDDRITHTFIRRFLSGICNIDSCYNAEEAIEHLHKNKYGLIFIDINLGSGKTGIDVLNYILGLSSFRDTPLVAVTAYAMPGDERKFLSLGFDHYISKPFTRESLLKFIEQFI